MNKKQRATSLGRLAATITAGLLLGIGAVNSCAAVLHWAGAFGVSST